MVSRFSELNPHLLREKLNDLGEGGGGTSISTTLVYLVVKLLSSLQEDSTQEVFFSFYT